MKGYLKGINKNCRFTISQLQEMGRNNSCNRHFVTFVSTVSVTGKIKTYLDVQSKVL